MTTPLVSDLLHDGVPRTASDWNNILNRFLNWVTDGNYDFTINSINANTYNNLPGFDITGILAGENIAAGDVVRLKAADSKIWIADSSTLLGVTNVLGISAAAYNTGEAVTIKTNLYTAYSGLTVGSIYYVATTGGISTSPGTFGSIIGTALSATTLRIDKSLVEGNFANDLIVKNDISIGNNLAVTNDINSNTLNIDGLANGFSARLNYRQIFTFSVASIASSGGTSTFDFNLGTSGNSVFVEIGWVGQHGGAASTSSRLWHFCITMEGTTFYGSNNVVSSIGPDAVDMVLTAAAEGVVAQRVRFTITNNDGVDNATTNRFSFIFTSTETVTKV